MTHTAARDEKDSAAARRGWSSYRRSPTLGIAGLLLLILVSAGLAYAISAASQPVYAARAELVYIGATGNDALDDQAIETQTALLTGRSILATVADAEGADLEELTEAVDAQRVDGSQIIHLTVQDTNASEATRIADAIVDAYLSTTSGTVTDPRETEFLNSRLEELRGQLTTAQQQGQSPVEQQLISEQIADVQSRLTDLQLANLDSSPPVRVISPAYQLSDPVGSSPLRSAAAGGLVGFVLSAGLLVFAVSQRRAAVSRR